MADTTGSKNKANEAAQTAAAEKAVAQTYEAKAGSKSEPAKNEPVAERDVPGSVPPAASKVTPAKAAPAKAKAQPAKAKAKPAARNGAPKPKKAGTAKTKAAPAKKTAAKPVTAKTSHTTKSNKPKETPKMATTTKNFTDSAKDFAGSVQSRMEGAYEKGSEMTGEMVAFQKANAEAMVESSKIYYAGLQDMGRMMADDGKSASEQMVEDVKDMAKVTTPTELVQLQGEIARRNFDAAIAFGSKATEKWMKLANDSFAPISNRMSVAADKVASAA